MAKRDQYLSEIRERLGGYAAKIALQNQNNRQDECMGAEDVCCGLLNRVYGYNLTNANQDGKNQAGVDLWDEKNGVAVQITATNTAAKVRHTLEEFCKGGAGERLCDRFDTLMVLVLTVDKAKGADVPADCDLQVLTLRDLSSQMEHWAIPKLKEMAAYLAEELGGQIAVSPSFPHVPSPSPSFIPGSRDRELKEAEDILADQGCVFLWGIGGMGKTQVAIQLAERMGENRTVWFLNYQVPMNDGMESLRHSILMADVKNYKFQGPDNENRDAEYRERLAILENHRGGLTLVVDNFDREGCRLEELQAEQAYRDLLAIPDLKLVFTTRSEVSGGVHIGPISEENLLTLIRNSYKKSVPEETLLALIRQVGGHTLMVDLMAKTLKEGMGSLTPKSLLRALREGDLQGQKLYPVFNDRNNAMTKDRLDGHLRKLFDLSGMDETRRRIMRWATLLPAMGMDVPLFEAGLEPNDGEDLRHLRACGWLTMDDEEKLYIHPVVREVCREVLKPGDENCGAFLERLWNLYDLKKEYHAEVFHQLAQCFTEASEHLEDWMGDWALYAGRYWNLIGQAQSALECDKRMVARSEENLSSDSQKLATAYNNVGNTYGALGDHGKALEYQMKAIGIWEKVLPPDHPDLATSYNNVGCTYGALGDHGKALKYKLKALAIREKILPPEHPDLAVSYNNVGGTYGDLGVHEKALEYKLKALAIREKVLPPDHPSLATSYNNVGYTYGDLGDHGKALEYQRKALAIHEKVLPPDHPDLAVSNNNVGYTYGDLGDHGKALEYQLKALAIREKILPPDHPDLATSYNNVGYTYGDLGDHGKALEYQLKDLAICEKVLPSDHLDLAISYHNVAFAYAWMGEFSQALVFFEKALTIREKKLPAGHPQTESTRRSIVNVKKRLSKV